MRNLILAAAAVALIAAPAGFASAAEKKAPTYDCTKKGNANKAACKTVAAAPAPVAAAAPMAKPAAPMVAAKPVAAPAAKPVAAAAAAAPTPVKGGGMKACATQWNGYTQAQKDAYKAKAEGKLSAKGHKLSGYNVFTGECMKK
jgi:hypothetical protein